MVWSLARLQPDTAARIGAAAGLLLWWLGLRRRTVSDNLLQALGLKGTARRRIARQAYATMGANIVELWCCPRALRAKLRCLNPHWLARLQANHGGSLVLVGSHLGQWDLAVMPLAEMDACGRLAVPAKPLGWRALDCALTAQRSALGMDVIELPKGEKRGLLRMLARLRERRCIGLLADLAPRRSQGWPVHFLGVPTFAHPGPVQLAERTGAALVPLVCVRRSATQTVVCYGRPIPLAGRSPQQALQDLNDWMSAAITRYPGQYLWHHRHFRRRWDPQSQGQIPAGSVSARGGESKSRTPALARAASHS